MVETNFLDNCEQIGENIVTVSFAEDGTYEISDSNPVGIVAGNVHERSPLKYSRALNKVTDDTLHKSEAMLTWDYVVRVLHIAPTIFDAP